jgi:hypothetical protein
LDKLSVVPALCNSAGAAALPDGFVPDTEDCPTALVDWEDTGRLEFDPMLGRRFLNLSRFLSCAAFPLLSDILHFAFPELEEYVVGKIGVRRINVGKSRGKIEAE